MFYSVSFMGIRKKIFLGFVVIGTVLLLSGVMAIYEFVSMRKTVSILVSDNIASINSSNLLIEVTDEYNLTLLRSMGESQSVAIPDIQRDTRFIDYLTEVMDKYTDVRERNMADSIVFAYTAYIHVMKEAPMVWKGNYQDKRSWYFDRMYPVYMKLRGYIRQLTLLSQEALAENSQNMSHSYYRSLMPCVVAVGIGIVLVFLFNYFINFYFIRPMLLITKGISNYVLYNKSYGVTIDNYDELQDLNQNVTELIDANKKLLKQCGKTNL